MAKILYIEDQFVNIRLVKKMLKGENHTIDEAGDGTQGLKMIAANNYDLILTDIVMGDMDGFELIKHLKANPELRHIPVIALTGDSTRISPSDYWDAGFAGFVLKPISRRELTEAINSNIRTTAAC